MKMNKLTVNQVALGSLKRRKGQYKAMILSAGLAIFFVSSLFLVMQSVFETYRLMHVARMGAQDGIVRDAEAVTPESLLQGGFVTEVGNVYVIGETEGSECAIGYYDETGAKLASRTLIEGRMPEVPGEIAVEPNFLQKLRSDAKLGDEIELTLKIPVGARKKFLPDPVKKQYTIVGVLKSQSMNLEGNYYSDVEYLHYPSAIVSDQERVELGGRAIIHRLVNVLPGMSAVDFEKYFQGTLALYNAISTRFVLFSNGNLDNSSGQIMVMIAAILGTVLVLSACLGIVNAFTASLSERRSQIGMMRAVGATSRQIRSIFGREALLLAALIAPVSIALSYLFVWAAVRLAGTLTFYVNPWFLPVDFIASLACVALAAWIPLMSASRVSPMQAIREVSLLRARKHAKVHVRSQYDAPRLIAGRHLTLYKTRQAGIAVMVALSMLMLSAAVPFVAGMWNAPTTYGYEINSSRWSTDAFVEQNVNAHAGLTDADVAEIAALPAVAGVDAAACVQINLLMDMVTPYAAGMRHPNFWVEPPKDVYEEADRALYNEFKSQQNLNKEVLPTELYACEESVVASLSPHVLEGEIDIDALNAGTEVLMSAPQTYYRFQEVTPDGYPYYSVAFKKPKNREDVQTLTNDTFHAGDTLDLLRLFTRGIIDIPEDNTRDFVTGIEREEAKPTIGATLNEDAVYTLNDLGIWARSNSALITTHAGLAAMGLEKAGYSSVGVRISETPDAATHAYLTDHFKGIAARGTDMTLINNVQSAKDASLWQTVMKAVLLAVALLLMSMCVSLVNSAITNRLRSEKRAIGTLRAVGAALPDIVRSYRLQALAMILWGVLAGVALSIIFYAWYYITSYWWYDLSFNVPFGYVALTQVIFLGAVALLCGINLSVRVREITRASIVSNIREL